MADALQAAGITVLHNAGQRVQIDGQSLWWPAIARNKRSVALNLRNPEGQELVRQNGVYLPLPAAVVREQIKKLE